MFKFINAEMTPPPPQKKEASAHLLEFFDFVCHVCCVL